VKRKASRKRRSVKRKASRKRRSVKRKASRKRRSVKRKASRKRRSVKRKASRKRRSVKRKASRKKKSAKRKASRKRRSVKRKASRKRKSAKRKASRKRKSAKRKASRKRKSAKRKSRKRNFGFFTQRMRDSLRRKYQRTKDSFGRTFSNKYISKHEFLPARKLPANLYPMFIQRFPSFKGRSPSSNPIEFKAKAGETASTFERRIDRLFKNFRQAMYKKNYIEARRDGYGRSMKEHIAEYKAKQAQEEEEEQAKQAKQAHQEMVRLANLKDSKLRKQCEFIQKQIQRAPKGPRRAALEKDFKERCARHAKLIMSNAEAAKRRRVFIASSKSMSKEDVARIREELDKYKRACANKGKNFSGRKNSSGQYICDDKGGAYKWQRKGSGWVKKNIRSFTGNTTIDKETLHSAALAQWKSVPLKEKIRRCRVGETKLAKATQDKNTQLVEAIKKSMRDKYCEHWIEKGKEAPTNSGSSYF